MLHAPRRARVFPTGAGGGVEVGGAGAAEDIAGLDCARLADGERQVCDWPAADAFRHARQAELHIGRAQSQGDLALRPFHLHVQEPVDRGAGLVRRRRETRLSDRRTALASSDA